MSYTNIIDFSSPWSADPLGHWSIQTISINEFGFNGSALAINAQDSDSSSTRYLFASPVDLSSFSEIRFWIKSSLVAKNLTDQPFYIRIIAEPAGTTEDPVWYRLIPVHRANSWDLVRLWIEDMPASLRSNIASLSIEATMAQNFTALFFNFIACSPNAIADAEQSLNERYHNLFTILTESGADQVDAIVQQTSTGIGTPAIHFSPVSISEIAIKEQLGTLETDNFTFDGAHTHSLMSSLRLEYAVDAITAARSEAAEIITLFVSHIINNRTILVAGRRVNLKVFEPRTEIRREFLSRSSTPIFISLEVKLDNVTRSFNSWAQPFLRIDANPPLSPNEVVPIQ